MADSKQRLEELINPENLKALGAEELGHSLKQGPLEQSGSGLPATEEQKEEGSDGSEESVEGKKDGDSSGKKKKREKDPFAPKEYTPSKTQWALTDEAMPLPAGLGAKCLVWDDGYVIKYLGAGFKTLSTESCISLGKIMIQSFYTGPVTGLAAVVAGLAMNLRSPKDFSPLMHAGVILCEADAATDLGKIDSTSIINDYNVQLGITTGDVTTGSQIQRFYQPPSSSALVPFLAGAQSATAIDFNISPEALSAAAALNPAALQKTSAEHAQGIVKAVDMITKEAQAAFYCFYAAVACRVITKTPEAVCKHLEGLMEKYTSFYDDSPAIISLGSPQVDTLKAINSGLKPGRDLSRSLIIAYMDCRKVNEDHSEIVGILDYTLLVHTSYNGMQLAPLSIAAARIMGQSCLKKLLRQVYCEATADSIQLVLDYFMAYRQGGPHHPSHYVPWCRILNDNYWSKLSIRHNKSLGALLMAICEAENSDIWQMAAFKADENLVAFAKDVIAEYRRTYTQASFLKGAFKGSMLDSYAKGMATRQQTRAAAPTPSSSKTPTATKKDLAQLVAPEAPPQSEAERLKAEKIRKDNIHSILLNKK